MHRLIFLGFCTLYVLSIGTRFYSSDAQVMYESSRTLAFHQTVALPEDFGLPQIRRGADGRWFSQYDPGLPLIAAPVVRGTDWFARINLWNRYAFSAFSVLWISALGAALALASLYDLACHLHSDRHRALTLTLVAGLCTPLWPYARLFFAEALLAGLLTAAFALTFRARGWSILAAGFLLGLAMLVRAATAIYLVPLLWLVMRNGGGADFASPENSPPKPPFGVGRANCGRKKRDPLPAPLERGLDGERISPDCSPSPKWRGGWGVRSASLILFPILAGLALMAHNLIRYDDPLTFGYAGQTFDTFPLAGAFGLLFSPGRSVFLYAPPLMLSVALFPRFWRANRAMAEALLLAAVIALLFYGAWWAWDGGTSWGPRFLVPLLALWMLPLGEVSKRERWALALLSVAGFCAAILGVFTDVNRHDVVNYSLAGSPLAGAVKTALAGDIEAPGIFQLQRMGWLEVPATVVPALLVLCSVICFVLIMVKYAHEQ